MTEHVRYRAMKPGEERTVSSLVTSVFHRHVAPLFSKEGIDEFLRYVDPAAIRERSERNHVLLVASAGPRLVGVIEVRNHDHVSLLFVETAHQRRGIARELLDRALVACRTHRPDLREIDVNASPNAVSAYERLGFRQQCPEQTKNGIRFVPMVIDVPRCRPVAEEEL